MDDTQKKENVVEMKPETVDEPTFAEFRAGMIVARVQMLAPTNRNALTNYIAKIYKALNVPLKAVSQEQTNALLEATLGIFAYTHAMVLKNKHKEQKP